MPHAAATAAGTRRYAERFPHLAAGHFRPGPSSPVGGPLTLASLGIGTYLGDPDERTDARYAEAVECAVRSGINVIDTAINYRAQRSERSIGMALSRLMADGFSREEIVISTKAGFIPFDGDYPADPGAYFRQSYLETGLLRRSDVVAACHCLAPGYLEDQLRRSRVNLGLDSIDIFYLHNPEMQLDELERPVFLERMAAAFAMLEGRAAAGEIGCYGCATWNGFRVPPDEPGHLSLEELLTLAREVGGQDHRFRVLQLPFNLGMGEAWLAPTQRVGSRLVPLLAAAAELGFTVMTSASILQGQLAGDLPADVRVALPGLETDAQRALQFARSTPGVTTALVGMRNADHVRENIAVACVPPATTATMTALAAEADIS